MFIARIFWILFCVFALFGISSGQPADSIEFVYAGSTLWSHVSEVCVRDNYAFCAMQHGLMILDISDPDNPVLISKYFLHEGKGTGIAIVDNYAFLCCNTVGLQLFDISDASEPLKVNEFSWDFGYAVTIKIYDNYAFVTGSMSKITTYDITNPLSPVQVGEIAGTIIQFDNTNPTPLLYSLISKGLTISDISDPAQPDSINTIIVPPYARSAAIDDTLAYICNDSAMYVFNITNPLAPLQIGHLNYDTTAHSPSQIQIMGDFVYMANGLYDQYRLDGGFFIIDISDPTAPEIVNHLPQTAYAITLFGDKIGVSDYDRYFHIYDLTNPVNPDVYVDIDIPDTRSWGFRGVVTNGLYAYVALGPSDLNVVDISNPEDPVALSGDYLTGGAFELTLRDNYLYVASGSYDDNGLYVFDISNPKEPSPIGFYSYSSPQEITLHENYAFMAGNHGNSIILDITNPANPELVALYRTGGITWGVAVNGNSAYHANSSGIIIVDISNISEPVVIDTLQTHVSFYNDAIIYNGYLVTGHSQGWFEVFDLTNPAAPTGVSGIQFDSDVNGLTPYGNYIFAAVGNDGMALINMENPGLPKVIAEKTFSGETQAIAVFDGYAFVVDQYGLASYSINLPSCCVNAGDANYDGVTNVTDIVYLINLVFKKGPSVNCWEAAEVNGDGRVNVADIVFMINFIFKGAPIPDCPD
ncbi:MAG: dockerin type I domain-containing protein [Candidatus Zixiibacteriota bacterium]